ncbi:MAG: hypothetical protein WC621_04815 [Patescibacteria group bacterium]
MNWPTKKFKEIYLVGANHAVQWNRSLSATIDYMQYLETQIKKFNIGLVAEEFSEEALRKNKVGHTTSDEVSKKLLLKNSFLCDPDEKTREKIGYPTQTQLRQRFGIKSAIEGTREYKARKEHEGTFWPVREGYWLDQIKNFSQRMIFVCGSEHIKSFSSLLKQQGYTVSILDKKFGLL